MADDIHRAMARCHERLWDAFIHPDLGLIYDYVADDEQQPFWWLPTPAEISRRCPNPQGWSTGMEDSSISGGVYLAAMVTAHRLTADEDYAHKAQQLCAGLLRAGTCSPERGFIARSLTPDGDHWYPASSVDQYTWWMHGMWAYARSGLATDGEVDAIRTVAAEVCRRLERDDWAIAQEDGSEAYYCDLGAYTPDRSTRLLEVLLIAWDLTGEAHWWEVYAGKVRERGGKRLDSVQDMLAYTPTPYAVLQTAASLVPLMALEPDADTEARYAGALKACARGMWYAVPALYGYDAERLSRADWDPDWRRRYPPEGYHKGGIRFLPPGWALEDQVVRRPCEAMMVLAYAADTDPALAHEVVREQLATAIHDALTRYDYSRLHSYAAVYAEALYWLGMDKGLVPKPGESV